MRLGNKTWSGAPNTLAREDPPASKALVINRHGDSQDETGFMVSSGLRTLATYGRGREGLDSNVIMAPVMWIMRTFTEARAVVQRRDASVWKTVEDHDAELLIERPNEAYDGDALLKATSVSYVMAGNAYWRKVRNIFGGVIGLWYIPHWLIEPHWPPDGSKFISHYEYRPEGGGQPIILLPQDVIHLRFGLDPQNPRLGLSPLRALLQEVYTDDEAALFSTTILRNMGIPGLVVSPDNDALRPSDDDIATLKAKLEAGFTGGKVGKALVMKIPTKVTQFGFDPNKLMLGGLRDIAEERVCAVIGIPAAVVGFGSGLQSTKVGATMRELVRLAWVQSLIPMQKSIARQLTVQLLGDFVAQTRRFRMRFDTSDVSAFQEDDDMRAKRIGGLVRDGVLRVDRAQDALGLEVDETRKIYLQPSNSMPIDEHGNPITVAAPPGAVAAGEAEDEDDEEEIPAAVLARRNGRNGSIPDDEEEG